MNKWNVGLSYKTEIIINNIEAETREKALDKAKKLVKNKINVVNDDNFIKNKELTFDVVNYIEKVG